MNARSTHPLILASAGLVLLACGGDGLVEPTESPTRPRPLDGAKIILVSGDNQIGKAGEPLDDAFIVQVTNAGGDPLKGVQVIWSVTPGPGQIRAMRTNLGGYARLVFEPKVLGVSTVTASAEGFSGPLQGSPVVFSANATVLVIQIFHFPGNCDDPFEAPCFAGPNSSSDVTVPVGATVEWVKSVLGEATVTSTVVPEGGASFDSGALRSRDRFQFIPTVTGTWHYVDHFSGITGTLTAQ